VGAGFHADGQTDVTMIIVFAILRTRLTSQPLCPIQLQHVCFLRTSKAKITKGEINLQVGSLRTTKVAHIRWRVDCVSYHSQAHCSWVAVMVAFCRLFFISFFSLISYAGPDSQTTLYTEFESIDWLLIANWIRKECACLGWEAGALKLHWLHTNESDGWRLFSGSILNVHLYLRECQVVHIIHPRS